MNKYLLAGMCLLAFAAGGAAHLLLQGTSAPEVKAEFAEVKQEPAAPAAAPKEAGPAAPPAAPEAGEVEPSSEAELSSEAEPASEEAAARGGRGASADVPEAPVREARVASAARASRTTRRRAVTRSRVVSAPAVASTVRPRTNGDGFKETTVGGAKKTGRWLRKGVKKIGGVFHD